MCRVMEEMRNEATAKNTLELIKNLMQSMKWTAEQAMRALMIPEGEQSRYMKML